MHTLGGGPRVPTERAMCTARRSETKRDAGVATAAPADRSVSDDTSEMDLSTQGERQDRRAASKRKLERKASPPPAGAAPPLPIPTQPPDAAHKKLRSPRRE